MVCDFQISVFTYFHMCIVNFSSILSVSKTFILACSVRSEAFSYLDLILVGEF